MNLIPELNPRSPKCSTFTIPFVRTDHDTCCSFRAEHYLLVGADGSGADVMTILKAFRAMEIPNTADTRTALTNSTTVIMNIAYTVLIYTLNQ